MKKILRRDVAWLITIMIFHPCNILLKYLLVSINLLQVFEHINDSDCRILLQLLLLEIIEILKSAFTY